MKPIVNLKPLLALMACIICVLSALSSNWLIALYWAMVAGYWVLNWRKT